MIDKIEAVIHEVLESREFKNLLYLKVLEKFGAKLADVGDESVKETVPAFAFGTVNETPEGLAWMFRSKLARRPNAQEDPDSLRAQFEALIGRGVSAQKIADTLRQMGKHVEPIWRFVERFKDEVKATEKTQSMADRAAETKRKLEIADGKARL
jgi:phosphoglycerate dehydrogenase-like enzyme